MYSWQICEGCRERQQINTRHASIDVIGSTVEPIVAKSPGLAGKSRFSKASPADLGHFPASLLLDCL